MSEEVKELETQAPVEQIDAAALEKAMVEAELKKQQEIDPVEMASMMLTIYTPRFCELIDKLSARQLRRVTKSIVEFPVGKTYKHTDPKEAEAFAIGKNLLDAKYVLVANTYNENRELILQQAAEAASNVTFETIQGQEAQEIINNENGN